MAGAIGFTAGVLHMQGIIVVLLFCMAIYLVSQMYSSKVLNANEDDFPNMELMMEGAGNAFGLFMLTWVVTFTYI